MKGKSEKPTTQLPGPGYLDPFAPCITYRRDMMFTKPVDNQKKEESK